MATSPATDIQSPMPLDGILLAEELLDLAERAQAYTNAAGVAIALRRGQDLLVRTSTGAAPEVGGIIPLSDGFIADCLKSRRPLCCRDTESDSRVGPLFRALRTRSLIAVPICEHRDARGVMIVIAPLPNAFQPTHTAILLTLSDIIASKLAARDDMPDLMGVMELPTPEPALATEPVAKPVVVPEAPKPVVVPEAPKPAPVETAAAAPASVTPAPKPAEPAAKPVVAPAPAAKPALVKTAVTPASATSAPKPAEPASAFCEPTKLWAIEPATTPAPAASPAVPPALLREAALPLPMEKSDAAPDPGLLSPSEDPGRFKPVSLLASSTTVSPRHELVAINLKPAASMAVTPALRAITADDVEAVIAADIKPAIAAWEALAAQTSKRPMMVGVAAVAAALVIAAGLWVVRSSTKEIPPPAAPVPAPVAVSLPPVAAAAKPAPPAVVKAEAPAKPPVAQPEQPKASIRAELPAVEPVHQPAARVMEIAAAQPKPKQEPEPDVPAPKLALASNDAALSSLSKVSVAVPSRPKSELVPATLLSRTAPVFPPIAKQMGVHGTVVMNVTISPAGTVSAVRVVSGEGQLRQAAISAVQQWHYKPAMLNGQPTESTAEVHVNFIR
jgi:protein TonB